MVREIPSLTNNVSKCSSETRFCKFQSVTVVYVVDCVIIYYSTFLDGVDNPSN